MEKRSVPDFSGLVRECYRSGGYVFARNAGEIERKGKVLRIARLASNENPRSPSPLAVEMGTHALRDANRYPAERTGSLLEALRCYHGEYRFVTGVGMDGVIETVIRTLVNPGERVAISVPTFSFYGLAATAQGADVVYIPRNTDFSVDPRRFIREAANAKVSFLCSPNNPTGTVTPLDQVEEILSSIPGILFLDNAYVEFCETDYRPLMRKYENLVLGRTLSKAFSLAGLRVGYAFVPGWMVECYQRAATPFTLNSVSSAAATGALQDPGHVEEAVSRVTRWRERFISDCRYPVHPSGANFVLVDVSPMSGSQMAAELADRGVLVRSCESFPGLAPHFIRVSIGDDWECEQFLEEINRI
ncbi:MAG: aminotransferase class I/II-fold pyridoxal phosphate-dependent enzyme [Methanolinea sp.]|nr:aminotransferase class I/II-fold pyridoxal phosphate-dependent enzyme [Methanolinea sp.]